MSKPTPGPWRAEPMVAYGRDIYAGNMWIGQANGDHGQAPGTFPTSEECDANAALFVASKDLLEALEGLLSADELTPIGGNLDIQIDAMQAARAAIAKAKP